MNTFFKYIFGVLVLSMASPLYAERMANAEQEPVSHVRSADFTAAEYLETRPANMRRPSHWPSKLTITPVEMNLDEAKTKVVGTWKLAFMCSGKPISADWFRDNHPAVLEGYYTRGAMFDYRGGKFSRYLLKPRYQKSMAPPQLQAVSDYQIVQKNQQLWIELSAFSPKTLSFVRVEETGEYLLRSNYTEHKCADGSLLDVLYVPLNLIS